MPKERRERLEPKLKRKKRQACYPNELERKEKGGNLRLPTVSSRRDRVMEKEEDALLSTKGGGGWSDRETAREKWRKKKRVVENERAHQWCVVR